MVDISGDFNARIKALNNKNNQAASSGKTSNTGNQDTRMSKDGSIFAGGKVSTSATARTEQNKQPDATSTSTSNARNVLSQAKNDEAKGGSGVRGFINSASQYSQQASAATDEAQNISQSMADGEAELNKDLTKFNKTVTTQNKMQKQNSERISKNEAQVTELQARLQNAVETRNAMGANGGFMGDGTSDINGMTAELESLGTVNADLQTKTNSSAKQVKNNYKTMTKSSKNLQKQAASYNRVTTSALALNSKTQAATADGIKKSQTLNVTGQVTTTVGSGLQATGQALSSNPYTAAAGQVLTYCGIGAQTSGGVMSAVGTQGQTAGTNTMGNLTTAAANLNKANTVINKTENSVDKIEKDYTKTNKTFDKETKKTTQQLNRINQEIETSEQDLQEVQGSEQNQENKGTLGVNGQPQQSSLVTSPFANDSQQAGNTGDMNNGTTFANNDELIKKKK